MAQRPDVIVLGGDYVSFAERRYMEPCAEALAGLEAPGGVLAILGNHDDDRYMPAALESHGFTVLKDRRTTARQRRRPGVRWRQVLDQGPGGHRPRRRRVAEHRGSACP